MLSLEVETTSLLQKDAQSPAETHEQKSMSRFAWMIVILATCGIVAAGTILINSRADAAISIIQTKLALAKPTAMEKQFFLMNKVSSLEEAIAICNTDHSEIASITSESENIAAFEVVVNNADADVWIGLIQGDTLHQWFWVNKDKYDYSNWRVGEPNNVAQHCAQMKRYEDGVWNDVECEGNSMYVLCQKKPVMTSPPTPAPTREPPLEVCEKDGRICHWFGDQSFGQEYCCDTCLNPTVPCNTDICNPTKPVQNFCLCTELLCLSDDLSKMKKKSDKSSVNEKDKRE